MGSKIVDRESEMVPDHVKKLHYCLLLIAEEIKRVCEIHQIKYFLIGGSLLGAIRHQGFIPWDDDMDIAMPRDEYMRFEKVVSSELRKDFSVCSMASDKYYGLPYIKIKLNGTIFPEESSPFELESGIFVDVFPLDVFPNDKKDQLFQNQMMRLLKRAILYHCHYHINDRKHSLFSRLAARCVSLCGKTMLSRWLFWVQTKYNNAGGMFYANLCSAYRYGKELFPRECIDAETKNAIFETTSFPVPSEPEKILKLLYGDFLQLPPEEERVFRHATEEIEFGIYA